MQPRGWIIKVIKEPVLIPETIISSTAEVSIGLLG
eukprot:COSAG06_NODE_47292_length_340_cov_0.825726_1_plen_34_part_10